MTEDRGPAPGAEDGTLPKFLISHEGRFYLTTGLWVYDPEHPGITDAQQEGVAQMADLFAKLAREGWCRSAVELPSRRRGHRHDHGGSVQHTT